MAKRLTKKLLCILQLLKKPRVIYRLLFVLTGAVFLIGLLLYAAIRFVPLPEEELLRYGVSSIIQDRDGNQLRAYLSHDQRWRIPVTLEEVSPWAVKATLAAEDKRFWNHKGVDFIAVVRAFSGNLTGRRIYSGASTITMQVAGFTIPSRKRTLSRKLLQTFRALQIEHRWSKKKILEAYLTLAPYGGNVCGIEAASWRYFNCPSKNLSLAQAALLAGLPQSPERYRPDRNLQVALNRQKHVLNRLEVENHITEEVHRSALKTSVTVGSNDIPINAPHFSDMVYQLKPSLPIVKTTLNSRFQKVAEKFLREKVEPLRSEGITNASVVILDNSTRQVLALVGSLDYNRIEDNGQINGALALRSPGSALKPFIYAEAFDQGLLGYEEILYDVPRQYGIYKPENYDKSYSGIVAAKNALALSLNLPALEITQRVGVLPLIVKLRELGIQTINASAADYGLSIAIGTCRVRLVDLTNAYATLASGGTHKNWTVFIDDEKDIKSNTPSMFSPEACRFITEALTDNKLRPVEQFDVELKGLENTAWKTGTSNGFKDAWTVAYTPHLTVGVWVGNMNGKGSRSLLGNKTAAPVALGIIKELGTTSPWDFKTTAILKHELCSLTGLPKNLHCPQTRIGLIQNSVLINKRRCEVHKQFDIDVTTSASLCTRCRSGKNVITGVYTDFPRSMAAWLQATGDLFYPLPPPHNPDCITSRKGLKPVIESPLDGSQLVIIKSLPTEFQKIMLKASGSGKEYFWFLNNVLVGRTKLGEELFINPKPGKHEIKVVDETGKVERHTVFITETD